jgi:hypothetical protein
MKSCLCLLQIIVIEQKTPSFHAKSFMGCTCCNIEYVMIEEPGEDAVIVSGWVVSRHSHICLGPEGVFEVPTRHRGN